MSTRATYEIEGHVFYIHHDGYPEYAVNYFLKMAEQFMMEDSRGHNVQDGGKAEAFLRANPKASFASSHEAYGDTEFRYTLEGNTITIQQRIDYSDDWKVWSQSIFDFCDEYQKADMVVDDRKLIKMNGNNTWHTGATVLAHLSAIRNQHIKMMQNGVNDSYANRVLTEIRLFEASYKEAYPNAS